VDNQKDVQLNIGIVLDLIVYKRYKMVKTIQVSTELTVAEINDLKRVTNKNTNKEALQDAVEYRIMHAPVK